MQKLFSYMGGKSSIAKIIAHLIPKNDVYCEVFCGSANVFFEKQPSRVEVLNDVSSEIINLYKIVKFHLPEFIRLTQLEIVSESEFKRHKNEDTTQLTDVQKAVRLYYLLAVAYGSKYNDYQYARDTYRHNKIKRILNLTTLEAIQKRLVGVYLESLNYDKCIETWDESNVCFYLDPPYYGFEDYYGKDAFNRDDFVKLRDILLNLKGKFLLSINDVPEIREIYKDFYLKELGVMRLISPSDNYMTGELIITNFQENKLF